MLIVASDSLAGIMLAKSLEYETYFRPSGSIMLFARSYFLKIHFKIRKSLFRLDLHYPNPVSKDRAQDGIC